MIRRSLFLLLLLFTGFTANAGTISGKLVGPDNKPIEFAVVTVLAAADSSLVKGDVTGADGSFAIENLAADTYIVRISFTGFTTLMDGPHVLPPGQDLVLPGITMTLATELSTATVSAIRPLFEQKPGKLVMNVESSPIRIAGTAWDLLGKCPGVFIDQNSNITLKGKQGIQVYIDNRPTYLSGDVLKNYLQGIPAADIVKVEIISNPSAKYDAEGTAGILNLVTQKGSRQGLNAAARLGYGYGKRPKYYSGLNFNYAKEKYNVYGAFTVNRRYDVERILLQRSVPFDGETSTFTQDNTMYHENPVNIARLGVDFTPKEKISFGFRVEGFFAPEFTLGDNTTAITSTNGPTMTLHQVNYIRQNSANGGGGVNYRQQFDSLGREFTASFDYLQFGNRNNQKYNLHFYDADGAETVTPSFQRSLSSTDIFIYVGKADYTHPFNEKYSLEAGVKTSYVKTDNTLNFELLENSGWVNDTLRSNRFIYTEQINAAYLNGNASFKKLEVMIGLRMEQTISDGQSPTTGQQLKRSYVQLFPNVSVTHKINDANAISYSYSRRINRPDYENLNPFVFYLDQYTYQTGNPFLQPEIAHSADITYSYMGAAYLSVGFIKTKHAMQDVTQQIDSTGITFQTTKNFNDVNGQYASLGFPVPIGEWFLMENEISWTAMHFQSDLFGTPVNTRSNFVNMSTNVTFSLKHDFKIMAWSWYQTGMTYGIFQIKPVAGTGFGFSKSFMDNTLQLNLSFMDIFQKNGNRVVILFQNQNVTLREVPESPQMFFMARYRFGNTKAARKSQFEGGADDLKDRTGK